MSVVNEFNAKIVRYSQSESKVYVIDEHDARYTFNFTIRCKTNSFASPYHFFFNLSTHQCLLIRMDGFRSPIGKFCQVMRFWLQGDQPVLSVRLFDNQDKIMADIADQFSEQYASLILDGIINAD